MINLDFNFIDSMKRKIEDAIVPAMEMIYLHDNETYRKNYRPGFKIVEKTVSYFDYSATGISVLAKLAIEDDSRAFALIRKINNNIDYYRNNIYMHELGGQACWNTPLRRILFHVALAYKHLSPILSTVEKQRYFDLINEQIPIVIKHCDNFLPNETDLHCSPVNNHTAIFMHAVYYCGKIFGQPEWEALALDFAERFFTSGHSDGYFEEHTNKAREGGPSLIYTSLTAGCLYDVLDGRNKVHEKFIHAGSFYRSFLNYDFNRILIADERTNCSEAFHAYGLALHSLTSQGRYFIVKTLESMNFSKCTPERMAVIHHELDLMICGDCSLSENRIDGASRISLPLGILRKNGFTAGISALQALNRVIAKNSDYALDQQNLLYLSHKKAGIILTGIKSKNDFEYSTFRIGEDAYPVKTGILKMGDDWTEASVYYKTFNASIRWEIGKTAKLILSADTDKTITTSLPITDDKFIKTDNYYEIKQLSGFSPYTKNNINDNAKSLIFQWKKTLTIEFETALGENN
jgi:hypothetical protein